MTQGVPWLRAGPSRVVRAGGASAVVSAVVSAIVAILTGCGIAASTGGPPVAPTAAPSAYPAVIADTRRLIVDALGGANVELADATQPFRPPEGPSLVSAPRGVFRAVLPDDPNHGYIVVYSFRDVAAATAAATDQATYIGSGPGRVQFPPDTQFLLQQIDTTVVFYSWSPANSTDARAPAVFTALGTVGLPIPVPR